MQLLDFPSEILQCIFEQLGPDELKKNPGYWTICKRFYWVAHEVFLLPSVELSESSLYKLPSSESPFFEIGRGRVRRLSVYLVGQPSNETSLTPWAIDHEQPYGAFLNPDVVSEWRPLYSPDQELGIRPAWRSMEEESLQFLGENLRRSTILEEFIFEASTSSLFMPKRRYDYIEDVTMTMLVASLPESLTALTLDTRGTELITAGFQDLHLCPLIARRIGRIRTVRLRMRCICPEVFNISRENRVIEALIVRLSLPLLFRYAGGGPHFDSRECPSSVRSRGGMHEINRMLQAGMMLAMLHKFKILRVSFRVREPGAIDLVVFDCIAIRYLGEPSRRFCYEDDGRAWESWEDSETLQVVNRRGR